MKGFVLVFSAAALVFLNGCAMQEDILILDSRITALDNKINAVSGQMGEISKGTDALQEQLTKIKHELKNMEIIKAVEVLGKKQANMGMQLEDIKAELMRLRGTLEQQENRRQELATRSEAGDSSLAEKMQGLSKQFDSLQAKIIDLEKAAFEPGGLQKKVVSAENKPLEKEAEVSAVTDTKAAIATEKTKIKVQKSAKEDYDEAYKLFQKNAYRQAIEKFRAFLKGHPDSNLAGNARYWLGDCYYQQERYEEAILEYEKVIQGHKGSKVPDALLKEGLAFHHLGEVKTARLVLEKLLEEYPKSKQAGVARAQLKRWGKK